MKLRSRIAVAVSIAVAAAAIIATGAAYVVTRRTLIGDVDNALRDRAREVQLVRLTDAFGRGTFVVPEPGPDSVRSLVQLVDGDGDYRIAQGQQVSLPITERVLGVATGRLKAFASSTTAGTNRIRMLTVPIVPASDQGSGLALQVAVPLTRVAQQLRELAAFLFAASLLAVAGAAVVGAMVARAIVRPVQHLTRTAELVASTRDLRERIAVSSSDELGRLADSFNQMLSELDAATSAQRQLVADASHELRTPIASLRTNIEVLARGLKQAPEPVLRIVEDLVSQSAALSRLVADLLDLSREADPAHAFELVALDELVDSSVDKVRAAFPRCQFDSSTQPVTIRANPIRIERAVTNLLENAAKWNPLGQPVQVTLASDGSLTVTDHGPGVAREHRERIFERFWRAPEARSASGSGLGLAIVRRIAADHGGTAHVEDTPGGGASFVLRLPAVLEPAQPAGRKPTAS